MSTWGHLRSDESGMTLVELLVTMTLAVTLLSFAMNLVPTAQRSERSTRLRAEALGQQRAGLERLTREIRHATAIHFLDSRRIEVDTWVRADENPAVRRRVRYDCSSGTQCARLEGPLGGPVASPGRVVLTGLENPDVFVPEPNFVAPRYIGVVARVRFAPGRPLITVRDGVALRNVIGRT